MKKTRIFFEHGAVSVDVPDSIGLVTNNIGGTRLEFYFGDMKKGKKFFIDIVKDIFSEQRRYEKAKGDDNV